MNILSAFWRYWKSLCIWLGTAFVVLLLVTVAFSYFKGRAAPDASHAEECIDSGGTWEAENALCRTAA